MSRFRFSPPKGHGSILLMCEIGAGMRWDRIARAWTQLVAKVTPPRRLALEAKSNLAGAPRVASFAGDFYKEPGITPYRPERRIERGDSAQHLSASGEIQTEESDNQPATSIARVALRGIVRTRAAVAKRINAAPIVT